MNMDSYILSSIIILSVITVSIIISSNLGVGTIAGFIISGIIIGPNTPGPIATTDIEGIQNIADFGVVLFLFTLGLEMKPRQLWTMRKTILLQGFGQVILTALTFSLLGQLIGVSWEVGLIIGAILSQSSTAVVMTILREKEEFKSATGKNIFSNLMAQDMSIVPIMALIPIVAHHQKTSGDSFLNSIIIIIGLVISIFVIARYILPTGLRVTALNNNREGFALSLFLFILITTFLCRKSGVSETLGAFLLGMFLSNSDFRVMLEEVVSPLKRILMGLFFLSVGMTINPEILFSNAANILAWLLVTIFIKFGIFTLLSIIDGKGLLIGMKTGLALSQVGELAFVLLGIATTSGVINSDNAAIGFIIVSISMIITPWVNSLGNMVEKYIPQK